MVLYITNAPYDEIMEDIDLSPLPRDMHDRIDQFRRDFSMKLETGTKTILDVSGNNQMQRKMNPSMDVIEPNNLVIYPEKEANAEVSK